MLRIGTCGSSLRVRGGLVRSGVLDWQYSLWLFQIDSPHTCSLLL